MSTIIYKREKLVDSSFNLTELFEKLGDDSKWIKELPKLQNNQIALHLAILHEPYLNLILKGMKTVETRFSIHRQAPYEQIARDDIILLKETSGPIVGFCRVSDCWFYKLNQNTWDLIKNDFFKEILVKDMQFWDEKKNSSYASLIRVCDVHSLKSPVDIHKRDRRGWVILTRRDYNTKLDV